MRSALLLLLTAIWLAGAGCTVGPAYRRPEVKVAPGFTELEAATNASNQISRVVPGTEALTQWWKVFGDRELDSLVQRAMAGNRDLRQAASRVRQAQAQRAVVASGLLPEIDATGGFDHSGGSQNVVLPFGGGGAGGGTGTTAQKASLPRSRMLDSSSPAASTRSAPPGGPNSPLGLGGLPGATTDLYQVGLDTSWDVDVFGGTRRAIESARAEVAASEEDRRGVLILLLAEVATNYFGLRTSQQRLELARNELESQRQTLAIVKAKFNHGLGTDQEIAQQSAETATAEAAVPPLEMAAKIFAHRLGYLIGKEAGTLASELVAAQMLPAVPPEVPVGVPSDLLRRRPDIRRAERLLAAATARIGVATADLFPKFSLTAMAGMDSSQPGNLIDWNSRYFGVSPGVRWPILDWGRIRGNIRVQNELQKQALDGYEDSIARALTQVEDELVRYQKEQARQSALSAAARSSEDALVLARRRYENGVTDLQTVLTAERSSYAAQDAVAQSNGAICSGLIRLYVALGGGWQQ